ncbi:MAG: transposase, partial [Ruthenibacterium sp.]
DDHSVGRYRASERGIRLSGPAPGRPPKDVQPDKKQNYIDECERVEVERRFSLAKRVCGLDLITARLKETARHCIAMSILVQLIGIAVFNEKIGVCSVDIK